MILSEEMSLHVKQHSCCSSRSLGASLRGGGGKAESLLHKQFLGKQNDFHNQNVKMTPANKNRHSLLCENSVLDHLTLPFLYMDL